MFVPQPHKEERFLFPIYTLVALSAAVCLVRARQLLSTLLPARLRLVASLLHALALAVFALLCISRATALYKSWCPPHMHRECARACVCV